MWKYVVIYTFLIMSGRKPTMEQYGRFFTNRHEADVYLSEVREECSCDSSMWKYISRSELKDGVIIMVELDSMPVNKLIKKQ